MQYPGRVMEQKKDIKEKPGKSRNGLQLIIMYNIGSLVMTNMPDKYKMLIIGEIRCKVYGNSTLCHNFSVNAKLL